MWITPNYEDTDFTWPLNINSKITIFLDRTYGWQLDIADQCINGRKGPKGAIIAKPIPHSGFAVLHIVLSYFEMIAKYRDGFAKKRKSEDYFKEGVYFVFPQLKKEPRQIADKLLKALYEGGRCGLYHSGMTDPRIILTGGIDRPMDFDEQTSKLMINPHLLVPALKTHLKDYGKQLQNVKNIRLRQNFEKRFNFDVSQT